MLRFESFKLKLLLIFFLHSTNFLTAQNKSFMLVDKQTNKGITNANIDYHNGNGTHSDVEGFFTIPQNILSVRISYTGYENLEWKVDEAADTIFLERATEFLNEVSVTKGKRNYQQIFPKKGFNDFLPENFGSYGNTIESFLIEAVYIPNESKDSTKIISKIIIYPTDYTAVYLGVKNRREKQKDQKYAPFKINLYTVDTIIGIPMKRIFETDITVQLKQGEKKMIYELTLDQELNFPIEGVFIAISSFKDEYYKEIGFKSGPAFKTIGISEKSVFKVYQKSFAFCETDEECKWFRDRNMWERNNTYYVGLEIY